MSRASKLLEDHKSHMRAKLDIMDDVEKHSAYLVESLKEYRKLMLGWQGTLDDFLKSLDEDEGTESFDEDFDASVKVGTAELKYEKNGENSFPKYYELLNIFFTEYSRVLDKLAEAK